MNTIPFNLPTFFRTGQQTSVNLPISSINTEATVSLVRNKTSEQSRIESHDLKTKDQPVFQSPGTFSNAMGPATLAQASLNLHSQSQCQNLIYATMISPFGFVVNPGPSQIKITAAKSLASSTKKRKKPSNETDANKKSIQTGNEDLIIHHHAASKVETETSSEGQKQR